MEKTPRFSRNQTLEFKGETRTVNEWAKHLNIAPATLMTRLYRWPLEKALGGGFVSREQRGVKGSSGSGGWGRYRTRVDSPSSGSDGARS